VRCLGTQNRNPNLKPESALNTDLGENPSPKPKTADPKTRRIIRNPEKFHKPANTAPARWFPADAILLLVPAGAGLQGCTLLLGLGATCRSLAQPPVATPAVSAGGGRKEGGCDGWTNGVKDADNGRNKEKKEKGADFLTGVGARAP
jgi:hypothetical protein